MQDLQTGEMKPLPDHIMDAFRAIPEKPLGEMEQQFRAAKDELQRAADVAIPVRENQGPTFFIGEELELKGGRFRVHAITEKRLYLNSIPSKK